MTPVLHSPESPKREPALARLSASHMLMLNLQRKQKEQLPMLPLSPWEYSHQMFRSSIWGPSSSTSFDGTREPFRRLHHVSRTAMRQESTIPAARMQNTPARLLMSRAPPFCFASTEEYRSHWPFLGHHLCLRMSMSPLCCSSRILGVENRVRVTIARGDCLAYNLNDDDCPPKDGRPSLLEQLVGRVLGSQKHGFSSTLFSFPPTVRPSLILLSWGC